MLSIRYHILLADILLLVLGATVLAFVVWVLLTGGWNDIVTEVGTGVPFALIISIFWTLLGGAMAGKGLLRIASPRFNAAWRMIDRVGARKQVVTAMDAQLAQAPMTCGKFRITPHWLVLYGRLGVKIAHVDDVVLVHMREWKPEHKELVLCDSLGEETCFRADGFELTRVSQELRQMRPDILFDDAIPTWDRWRASPAMFIARPPLLPQS